MAILDRLNSAFRMLVNGSVKTTRVATDLEYHESSLADIISIDNNRRAKYKDYIYMDDNYGQEVSSALDAIADSVIRLDEPIEAPIKVMSESEKTVKFVKDLYMFLDISNKLWTWSRSLGKFGDLFVEIIWAIDGSNKELSHIIGLKALSAKTIELNVKNGVVDYKFPYKQVIDGNKVAEFRSWQLVHFILRREPSDDFGTSLLKAARIPYRQLTAMENALVLARIKKINMRIHKIDITGKTIDQVPDVVNDYKKQFKEKIWINPSTRKIEKHKIPVLGSEDIYMGVTQEGGKFAGIDIIEGKSEVDINDILYIREKLMVALKVPKHRININDIGSSNKLVSSDQGLHFSASIQRIQLAIIEGLSFVTDLALIVKGIDVKDRTKDYVLSLPKQRTVDELIAARVVLIKSTVAKNYKEMGLLSDEFIMSDIIGLEPDRISKIKKQMEKFRKEIEKNGGDDQDKDKNSDFNKTGTGSAPVRKPQKEVLQVILNDPEVKGLVNNVIELMRNQRVYRNKRFDMECIEKELSASKDDRKK